MGSPSIFSSSSSHPLSSEVLLRGDHVILFSFLSLRRALANHVDTCVKVILVIIASMIFSPLVGYGFFLCSWSQAFRVLVVSLVAFFLLVLTSTDPYLNTQYQELTYTEGFQKPQTTVLSEILSNQISYPLIYCISYPYESYWYPNGWL